MPEPAEAYPAGLTHATGRNRAFRDLLAGDRILVAPGAYDCITARLVEAAGFAAVYVTGSGLSMSRLGAPDVGLVSFAEVLDQVRRIADVVQIPVLADADTGYGGALNVIRTVREFERAGVSAIQIEDQEFPKKCGHELGRRVVPTTEMVARIKAAVDARLDPDFAVIARTDARTTEGIEAAIDRALAYGAAGADILFVESPESADEMARINRRIDAPTLANMVEGGRTPMLPAPKLEEIGYRVAIFPNSLTRLLGKTASAMLADLRQSGTTSGWRDRMYGHRELWDLFDYDRWLAVERRFTTTGEC